MQPGLQRAIPISIMGFMLGILVVFLLRAAQNVQPAWDAGVALTLASFSAAFFFVWGMGAFNPKMSEHGVGHDHADEEHSETEEDVPPRQMLSSGIWSVTFWTIVVLVVVGVIAFLPGLPTINIAHDPVAQPNKIGFIDMELFGQPVQVSELVFFILFFAWTILSLAIVAALIGGGFWLLSRETTRNRTTQPTLQEKTPPFFVRWAGNFAGWVQKILTPRPKQLL